LLAGAAWAAPAAAQTRTVAGRVFEARTGQPISAGRVAVRGLDVHDRIRPDGVFVLHVPVREVTLDVTSPGYVPRAITIGRHEHAILVTLDPEVVHLAPIRAQPGGIAAGAGEQVNRVPAASLTETLAGSLSRVTSIPGSRPPLYVVDGVAVSDARITSGVEAVTGGQAPVPGRIGDLNLADIAKIEILRGAVATAAYGSLGANGVIVINTYRRGR
jgi:TonB-dependent SusC/RagA subfamily outer membrane receptor